MPATASIPIQPSAAPQVGASGALRRIAFNALGTRCEVSYAASDAGKGTAFERACFDWVANFERRYSRFRPDSIVSRINAAAGLSWVEIDDETEQMLDVCQSVFQLTGGMLDVTSGPLLRLWDYRNPLPQLPDANRIADALALVGWGKVRRERGRVFLPARGMSLDFGGWGKEWAVDSVAQIAASHGIRCAMIDFGHDIRCLGAPPDRPAWHIGLEDPDCPGTHRGSVALAGGQGIASSGDYLRGFTHAGRRYGHIVDPRTGRPVENGCRQVTVIAGSCFQAGLLSTVAFILGPKQGMEFIQRLPGAEGLIVRSQGRAETRGFWQHVVT